MLNVIEGCDGSGKSTHAKRLVERMNAFETGSARLQVFPDRTTAIGKAIDGHLKREWHAMTRFSPKLGEVEALNAIVLQALMLANRAERLPVLNSAMTQDVVCDRYWASALVYGSAIDRLSESDVLAMHEGLPEADLNILLDVPPEVAKARLEARRGYPEAYERMDILTRARTAYRDLWFRMRQNHPLRQWVIIDGSRPKEVVEEAVMDAVLEATAARVPPPEALPAGAARSRAG